MTWSKAFDLRSMEIFLTVTESESMASAAKKLDITQAAVSQNISKIEDDLGAILIDRSLRPLRLTPAGTILRSRARHVLELAKETRTAVQNSAQTSLPELRIAVVNSLAGSLLPSFYDRISAALNIESLTLWSGFVAEHYEALIDRRVDVIIATDVVDNVTELSSFEILKEPFIIVLPVNAPCSGEDIGELAAALPLLRYSARNLTGRTVDQHLRRLRLSIPRRIAFDSSWSVGRMIKAGRGWAIMTPLCLLEANLNPDEARCVEFPGVSFSRRIHVVARSGELMDMPHQIAQVCRQTLDNEVREEISAFAPWLDEQFVVPGETDEYVY